MKPFSARQNSGQSRVAPAAGPPKLRHRVLAAATSGPRAAARAPWLMRAHRAHRALLLKLATAVEEVERVKPLAETVSSKPAKLATMARAKTATAAPTNVRSTARTTMQRHDLARTAP